jgi:hypothetical protein
MILCSIISWPVVGWQETRAGTEEYVFP